jgi:hypothetical protein
MKDIIAITVFLLVAIAIARPVSAWEMRERGTASELNMPHESSVTGFTERTFKRVNPFVLVRSG